MSESKEIIYKVDSSKGGPTDTGRKKYLGMDTVRDWEKIKFKRRTIKDQLIKKPVESSYFCTNSNAKYLSR